MNARGPNNGDQIFSNPNQNLEDKLKGNTEDAPYFQRRMLRTRGQANQSDPKDPFQEQL